MATEIATSGILLTSKNNCSMRALLHFCQDPEKQQLENMSAYISFILFLNVNLDDASITEFISWIPPPTLYKLNELEGSRTECRAQINNMNLYFQVTFSLALPSSLLKFLAVSSRTCLVVRVWCD